MIAHCLAAARPAVAALLLFGLAPAVGAAADLTRYREFVLGADLPAIVKLTGASPSHAKVLHRLPALLQELEWHPQPLGSPSRAEAVKEVVFGFYNGELYRIQVTYDRYETEGLTADDIVNAMSAGYGPAVRPPPSSQTVEGIYGEREDVIAQWQDAEHRFELIQSAYGPTFQLRGVMKRLEAAALAAGLEAVRLEAADAPRRDAERIAREDETERAKLEKARLENKPKFRP